MERQNNLNKIDMANNEKLHQDCELQNEVLVQIKQERDFFINQYSKLITRISDFISENEIMQCRSKCPLAQLEQLFALINSKDTATIKEEIRSEKERCSEIEETIRKIRQKLNKVLHMTDELEKEKMTLQRLLEQKVRTLRHTEGSKCSLESELANVLNQVKSLTEENTKLEKEKQILEESKIPNEEAMTQTESYSNIPTELQEQESLQENVKLRLEKLHESYQKKLKAMTFERNYLTLDSFSLQEKYDDLLQERGHLQNSFTSRTDELRQMFDTLKNTEREVQHLKCQLSDYVRKNKIQKNRKD